jgi:hypothetical protein
MAGWTHGFTAVDKTQHRNNFSPYPHGDWGAVVGGLTKTGLVQNTGVDVEAGDRFDVSLSMRSGWNWQSGTLLNWRLFITADDTETGAVTVIASGQLTGLTDGWEANAWTGTGTVSGAMAGRDLWIMIWSENGASDDGFAQVDDVGLVLYRAQTAVPPPAPTGVTAEAVSSEHIDLSWSDAADPAEPSDGFRVERSPDGESWSVGAENVTGTAYSDGGRSPHTRVHYRVTALRGGEESAASETASARTWTVYGFPDDNDDGVDDRWMDEHFAGQGAEDTVSRGGVEMTLRDLFIAGLDPADGTDRFELLTLDPQTGEVTFDRKAGREYEVSWTDDLGVEAPVWRVRIPFGSETEETPLPQDGGPVFLRARVRLAAP